MHYRERLFQVLCQAYKISDLGFLTCSASVPKNQARQSEGSFVCTFVMISQCPIKNSKEPYKTVDYMLKYGYKLIRAN
jgi:hypothetical protein